MHDDRSSRNSSGLFDISLCLYFPLEIADRIESFREQLNQYPVLLERGSKSIVADYSQRG
jgi:hypothetical protein